MGKVWFLWFGATWPFINNVVSLLFIVNTVIVINRNKVCTGWLLNDKILANSPVTKMFSVHRCNPHNFCTFKYNCFEGNFRLHHDILSLFIRLSALCLSLNEYMMESNANNHYIICRDLAKSILVMRAAKRLISFFFSLHT